MYEYFFSGAHILVRGGCGDLWQLGDGATLASPLILSGKNRRNFSGFALTEAKTEAKRLATHGEPTADRFSRVMGPGARLRRNPIEISRMRSPAAPIGTALLLSASVCSPPQPITAPMTRPRCPVSPQLALPPQGFVVRPLAQDDILPVARLLRDAFAPKSNPVSGLAIVAEHVLGLRERRATNVLLVAAEATTGEVIGSVECFTPTFLASQLGDGYPDRVRLLLKPYLASLAVKPTARRRGVASALVVAVEESVERGAPPHVLTLEVEENDKPAIALYTKLGYTWSDRSSSSTLP